jgi:predicted flavoprotein YhiN
VNRSCDILIIGAGAAGLFAATWAGRTARELGKPLAILAVDGARKPGAKILVAGGGRCNLRVTIMQGLGIEVNAHGDSTGTLGKLTA